jgi:hypothetical protein
MVVGPRHGAWGVERYGVTPCKADALDFYTGALQQQLRELQQLQHQVRHQLPRPAAFVTFKYAARKLLVFSPGLPASMSQSLLQRVH